MQAAMHQYADNARAEVVAFEEVIQSSRWCIVLDVQTRESRANHKPPLFSFATCPQRSSCSNASLQPLFHVAPGAALPSNTSLQPPVHAHATQQPTLRPIPLYCSLFPMYPQVGGLLFLTATVVLMKYASAFSLFAFYYRYDYGSASLVALGLSQISEFSFVLASHGRQLGYGGIALMSCARPTPNMCNATVSPLTMGPPWARCVLQCGWGPVGALWVGLETVIRPRLFLVGGGSCAFLGQGCTCGCSFHARIGRMPSAAQGTCILRRVSVSCGAVRLSELHTPSGMVFFCGAGAMPVIICDHLCVPSHPLPDTPIPPHRPATPAQMVFGTEMVLPPEKAGVLVQSRRFWNPEWRSATVRCSSSQGPVSKPGTRRQQVSGASNCGGGQQLRQQPAHPQYANYWAPLTRKRHTMPHPAQPQHINRWAPRTRKRNQQEHRPQRPTESSDPTQHAKGRTGDRPGPRKGATTRRNVTQGVCSTPPPPPRKQTLLAHRPGQLSAVRSQPSAVTGQASALPRSA